MPRRLRGRARSGTLAAMIADAPFVRLGAPQPLSPVVVTVPHAGRDYPAALADGARVPVERLVALEDRYADRLIADVVADGAVALVARRARAWIDLNRDPRELDPEMLAPPPADSLPSPRVRGGLGLVPRRIAGVGEIYGARLDLAAVHARIVTDHAPWHAAVAEALAAARARFGVALLIECHSMPPLGPHAPVIVLGDRFGRSAHPDIVAAAEQALGATGLSLARNAPYAGGYTLDRHAAPARGIHAVQIEFCRSLYLDAQRREPGSGLPAIRRLLAATARAMADATAPSSIAAS